MHLRCNHRLCILHNIDCDVEFYWRSDKTLISSTGITLYYTSVDSTSHRESNRSEDAGSKEIRDAPPTFIVYCTSCVGTQTPRCEGAALFRLVTLVRGCRQPLRSNIGGPYL